MQTIRFHLMGKKACWIMAVVLLFCAVACQQLELKNEGDTDVSDENVTTIQTVVETPTTQPITPTDSPSQIDTAVIEPLTPTVNSSHENNSNENALTICLMDEPDTLYVHNMSKHVEQLILTTVYDNFITPDYQLPPNILIEPSNADSSQIGVQPVIVQSGDEIFDPAIMSSESYDGPEIESSQLIVTFTLKTGTYWSDGVPVMADDSVYAFDLLAHPDTIVDKTLVYLTASYEIIDQQRVRWTGIPNYFPYDYLKHFILPLPRHAWENVDPQMLQSSPEVTQQPLGWGPYTVEEWVQGSHITLRKNPFYIPEPLTERIIFKFDVEYSLAAYPSLTVERSQDIACDMTIFHSTAVPSLLHEHLSLITYTPYPLIWARADFIMEDSQGNPTVVNEFTLRQAITHALFDSEAEGIASLWGTSDFLPTENQFDITRTIYETYPYDLQKANTLLDELGWEDANDDGIREKDGENLFLRVGYINSNPVAGVGNSIVSQLQKIGIRVDLIEITNREFEQMIRNDGSSVDILPEIDLLLYHSPINTLYDCLSFTSTDSSGDVEFVWPAGLLRATNTTYLTRYQNSEFDELCHLALQSFDNQTYQDLLQEAAAIIIADIPVVPLFAFTTVAFSRPEVVGFQPISGGVESWNITEWVWQDVSN